MKKWFKRLALLLVSAFVAGSVYLKAQLNGWLLSERSPQEIANLIEPHLEIFKPAGDGPFKTILMFHGCGGDAEQQRYWGEVFQSWGYAAVFVNSYAGRGIGFDRALNSVCRGRELLGAERAADVHAALAWSSQQSWTSKNDLVLAGWSHGAWTLMDAFALHAQGQQAHGLLTSFTSDLASIRKVVLFYPYCGIAANTTDTGWLLNPRVLAIDVAEDTVVGARACDESYEWIQQSGTSVQHEVFEGVNHAFDTDAVSDREGWTIRTPTEAGMDAIEKAKSLLREFLR